MVTTTANLAGTGSLAARTDQLVLAENRRLYQRTDQLFAGLLILEYLVGLLVAIGISPYSWAGIDQKIHPHLWAAGFLGLLIISLPVGLAFVYSGRAVTRHVIATAQMAMAGLLIHLTGGRIETHFLVFGSLAFLAFYRDWRILITASLVTAADHLVRGIVWPQSIYGVEAISAWRWVEHAGWVVFEDLFLVFSCVRGNRDLRLLAERQSLLEATNLSIETQVQQRTAELETSRKALAETNAQFAGVLNAATHVAIIATDVDGVITLFSAGAETILGYQAEEMIGKQRLPILHLPDEIQQRRRQLAREEGGQGDDFEAIVSGARRGSLDQSEWTLIRKDGTRLTVSLTVTSVRNSAGEATGFLSVAEDITQRKKSEHELIAAREQAEQAARIKGEFLANMSHEIRTPMNGIIGMTELALDTNLGIEQREYLQTVKSSADSLLRIINDILDFSKIEAGKLELDPQPFQLRENLADAMKALAMRAHEKNLELLWHAPPDVPDGLIGDVGRLRQVLVNLVGNAIKFTEQGEVGVTVELESQTESSARLRFSVNDTGIGIPAHKFQWIFEPFSQADASTTRVHGGTGLGLSISRQIVRLFGGEIAIQSEVGSGSTFYFTIELPLSTEPPQSRRDVSLTDVRVLVVDDNATNRRILEEMLRSWNMKPTAVASGPEALDAMRQAERANAPFQLVLTDCHMPSMDGFMFVEELRKHSELSGATIMMLTSGVSQVAFERCRQLGIAATLIKPVKQSELQRAVTTTLSRTLATLPKTAVTAPAPVAVKPLHVLLVEDNLVNQRVAARILQKLGHVVTIAGDGQAGLDAIDAERFDVVLMDIQMPVLDGIAATGRLRERERITGRHLPVIAMTAHAMAGDRDRCLAAEMDDYVSKPIESGNLNAALTRVLSNVDPSQAHPDVNADPNAPTAERPACDLNLALARVDGDEDFLSELADVFLKSIDELARDLRTAVRSGNRLEIGNLAHAIKGSLGNFYAQSAYEASQLLESSSQIEEMRIIEELHQNLQGEIERLNAFLRVEADRMRGVVAQPH